MVWQGGGSAPRARRRVVSRARCRPRRTATEARRRAPLPANGVRVECAAVSFLIALLLVVAVHLPVAVAAWTQVGLLADDRHMVGAAVLRHRGDWTFASMWRPEGPVVADAATALYRPFVDLGFWLEQPFHGIGAFGYHVTNSVLHCATALLWFVLVRRLSGSLAAGLACALLFVGWPSHSEVTHWIAARTNVQSTFFASVALLLFDVGLGRRAGVAREVSFVVAALVAVVAVGTKESAVFVLPLAACLAWLRARAHRNVGRRLLAAALPTLPMAVLLFAWLWWRAHLLGTWGSGTHYGWHATRVGWQSCLDWIELLLAPRHRGYTAPWWTPVLWLLHGALAVVVFAALRRPAARGAAAVGAVLLAFGYLAGIGLETMDPATLENARYSYEPVLGIAICAGVALATLPARARGAALAVLVLVHAIVLDQNRGSWLQAAAVYRRLEHEVVATARATQRPLHVLQAPGVYEGAFALLNGYTEFLFLQQTAPPGTNLRGQVASTQEWRATLQTLAAAATARQAPADAWVVQWDDGALVPLRFDPQWPNDRIGYAWVARERPFVASTVPVHVWLLPGAAVRLQARVRVGARVVPGAPVDVAVTTAPQAVELALPLPADLVPGEPLPVQLLVTAAGREQVFELGPLVPTVRTRR